MNFILVVLNFLAWVAVVAVSTLAVTTPMNGVTPQEIAESYPNLFAPADITFSVIWPVICVLLFLFSVYQFYALIKRSYADTVIKPVSVWYIIASIFNIIWLFSWYNELIVLSFVTIVLLLMTLIIIYHHLHKETLRFTIPQELFVRLPFSVYTAWIVVAVFANAAVFLVSIGWTGNWYQPEWIWAIGAISLVALTAVVTLIKNRDYGYAAVIIWALCGIIIRRLNTAEVYINIVIACAASIAVIAVIGAVVLLKKRSN